MLRAFRRAVHLVVSLGLIYGLAPSPLLADTRFDPDGMAHAPALALRPSVFASDPAKAAMAQAHAAPSERPAGTDIASLRVFFGRYNDRLAARMAEVYPVVIEPLTVGGVRAEVVRPKAGVAPENAKRVLINLHGGAFLWGEGSGGRVEAIPIAARGRITVITVAYRQAPEHRYPAGSEDVAAVYRALLAEHKPGEIGIYGCSAGGILTAQAVARIVKDGLPAPGAIGTFCGSAAPLAGDSMTLGMAVTGDNLSDQEDWPYFAGASQDDPLVYPTLSPELLAKFPPTLLLAGSRDFALSSLFQTQRRLTAVGVDAELHVWDGLEHAFFMNPDLPESREAYDVIVRFFSKRLSR
jgi:acetyl esterase/lipase